MLIRKERLNRIIPPSLPQYLAAQKSPKRTGWSRGGKLKKHLEEHRASRTSAEVYVNLISGGGEHCSPRYPELLVRIRGLEPPLPCENMDLNHARLPIPPYPHMLVGLFIF